VVRAIQGAHFAALGSALFFVGLTVHVMMLIRAGASPEPAVNQTDPDTFGLLMSVIRREQYPPLNPFERQAPLGWQFGYYYGFLFKQFYFLGPGYGMISAVSTFLGPVFLALLGLFHGLRRARPLIFVPLASYLINGEALTLYLNFTDHEVRDRDYFYFAAFMFFAVFIGLGAAALLRYLAGSEGRTAEVMEQAGEDWRRAVPVRTPAWVGAAAVALLIIALLPVLPVPQTDTKWFEHDRSENRIGYEYAWNILAGLDENAIIFTNGDNDTFPIWYLQYVEHFRRDVTVVNLSLVNLPWYIKQLKHNEGLDMRRSDEEIDALRHRLFQDPRTGEQKLLMIKDYVLHDIITTNQEKMQRPVFFAVTIPAENMELYFPFLLMEGMAYRLTDERGPDDMPRTDADRVLANLLGVYDLTSLTTGDTGARQRRYASLAGGAGDDGRVVLDEQRPSLDAAGLKVLVDLMGGIRSDIYRGQNARHLLGNYPTAFNRAGYEAYQAATEVALDDAEAYQRHLEKAIVAFEASLVMQPWNQQAMDFYPLLLVQAYRDAEAKQFLVSLAGAVPQEVEERTVFNALRGMMRGGVPDLALEYVNERMAAEPDRRFYYMAALSLHQALGSRPEAEAVARAWQERSGAPDTEMEQVLETMRREALKREQQRIDDALEGSGRGN
jgi:hypothetical protein